MTPLPRHPLGHWPTPWNAAPRLADRFGFKTFHVKREDLAGAALGGNKIRQIELILGAAHHHGADTVVTSAASQSNFCRALAGACAAAGLACHLLLRTAGGQVRQGNLLLHGLFGATIDWTDETDPWSPRIGDQLAAIIDRLRADGRRPTLVRLPGETAALATAAWVQGAQELAADVTATGTTPDVLAVASGSGLTAAGLALGLKHAGLPTRVLAVSVQQPAARLLPWMLEAAARAGALLQIATRLEATDLDVTDDQVAPGYGHPSPASIAAVRRTAAATGLVLDPIYTGKAMAGLASIASPGTHAAFLHSGGLPGLFLHAGTFAP